MTKVNPYLTFNGNCEEAFSFYKSAFGREFLYIGRYKDVPSPDRQTFQVPRTYNKSFCKSMAGHCNVGYLQASAAIRAEGFQFGFYF